MIWPIDITPPGCTWDIPADREAFKNVPGIVLLAPHMGIAFFFTPNTLRYMTDQAAYVADIYRDLGLWPQA